MEEKNEYEYTGARTLIGRHVKTYLYVFPLQNVCENYEQAVLYQINWER